MIYFESNSFANKIFVHDPTLTVNSTNYSQVKGGWCEDFDHDQSLTASMHINKSVEIGVAILNHLEAISRAKMLIKNKDVEDT
jgi:hypothetical protein